MARPAEPALARLGSGSLTGRVGGGLGASENGDPYTLAPFLLPNRLLCKGSGPVSIPDGNKSITSL